jgi:hypothetical protein
MSPYLDLEVGHERHVDVDARVGARGLVDLAQLLDGLGRDEEIVELQMRALLKKEGDAESVSRDISISISISISIYISIYISISIYLSIYICIYIYIYICTTRLAERRA